MKKFYKLSLLIGLLACLFGCAFFMGNAITASAEKIDIAAPAEGVEPPVTPEESGGEETDGNGLQSLVDGFLAQLKAQYGEDYETYYNAIIGQWGSVEDYLLSLVTPDTPDAVASGWTAFVKWLGEYSPVWGSIFAMAAVIVVILCGKKALNKVANWVTGTGAKFKTLFGEVNKIDAALNAQSEALIKLLGEGEKFKEQREALEKTAEEINQDVEL